MDISFDIHNKLFTEEYLETEDFLELANKIKQYLSNNSIFEYIADNNHVVPVLNPDNSELTSGFVLNPISNESTKFLNQLHDFLNQKGRIYIS